MKHTLQDAYDRDAASYDARFEALQRLKYEDLLGARAERLAGAEHILDAGCGTGLFYAYAQEVGLAAQVLGVDFSRRMLEHAAERGACVLCADVSALPFAAGSFDAALCFTVLRIEEERGEAPVLNELYRVLRPNGLLALSVLEIRDDPSLAEVLAAVGFEIVWRGACGTQDVGYLCRREGQKEG